jgi:hypothetical protein
LTFYGLCKHHFYRHQAAAKRMFGFWGIMRLVVAGFGLCMVREKI